jgi:hypothetical protein
MYETQSAVRKPSRTAAVLLIASSALVLSCAGATLVDVWRDPDFRTAPLNDVLIVSMSGNAASRRLWEDGLVSELAKHGVGATPSYREFPSAVPDSDQVIDAVRHGGYDGAIVTHRLPTEQERHYVPGYRTLRPVTVLNPWGYYATYYREVVHPGHVETDRVVRHQTDVWSTGKGGDRLIWTGVGEVIDPSSREAVRREIARTVVPELARENIIPSGRAFRDVSPNERNASRQGRSIDERPVARLDEGQAARFFIPSQGES